MCKDFRIYSVLSGMSSSNAFPQGSGSYVESRQEAERLSKPEVMDDPKETVFDRLEHPKN